MKNEDGSITLTTGPCKNPKKALSSENQKKQEDRIADLYMPKAEVNEDKVELYTPDYSDLDNPNLPNSNLFKEGNLVGRTGGKKKNLIAAICKATKDGEKVVKFLIDILEDKLPDGKRLARPYRPEYKLRALELICKYGFSVPASEHDISADVRGTVGYLDFLKMRQEMKKKK